MAKPEISVPYALAQLLTAKPEDFKEPRKYDEIQELSRTLLRLLMVSEQEEVPS